MKKKEILSNNKQESPDPIEDNDIMNEKKMDRLLLELLETHYWKAIKKFLDIQFLKVRDSLMSIDPATQATLIARSQGTIGGIVLLETYINQLKELKKEKNKDEDNIPNY